jgi:nicotinamidase/pyrazinamidase
MTNAPSYYSPDQVGQVYRPDTTKTMEAGEQAGWSPAPRDSKKIALLTVDAQVDFVHEDGALAVPGSIEDMRRLIELIYREGHRITTHVLTVDTHVPFMIFFPSWWINEKGQHPDPFTIITGEDIKNGVWRAVVKPAWSHAYPTKLAEKGKKMLMIWPYHCMDMTEGINVIPPLAEAIFYHSSARHSQPIVVHKGHIPQTEFYSPLCPEVEVANVPGGTINTPILNILAENDEIWVAGEAKSHCVLEGMKTLVDYFSQNQPEVLERILFLMDCTSSVYHPDVDFDAEANAELQRMASDHGVHLIESSDLYT